MSVSPQRGRQCGVQPQSTSGKHHARVLSLCLFFLSVQHFEWPSSQWMGQAVSPPTVREPCPRHQHTMTEVMMMLSAQPLRICDRGECASQPSEIKCQVQLIFSATHHCASSAVLANRFSKRMCTSEHKIVFVSCPESMDRLVNTCVTSAGHGLLLTPVASHRFEGQCECARVECLQQWS